MERDKEILKASNGVEWLQNQHERLIWQQGALWADRNPAAARTEPFPVVQQIRIDGKNWNDIINLPCFMDLCRYGGLVKVMVAVEYKNGNATNQLPSWASTRIGIGDTIVEYENGKWGVWLAGYKPEPVVGEE